MECRDKTVLITGAGHGIGAAFAKRFAQRGARLVLVDVDEAALARTAENLGDADIMARVVDIGSEESRLALRDELQQAGRQVDILVNNVGIGYYSLFHETPWERIRTVLEVNVIGGAHLVWLFLPGMLERDQGLVLNVSSTGAFCGANKSAAYTGSKAFVTNFTEAIDMEVAGTGVRTLTAHPGATQTHFWEDAGTKDSPQYKTAKLMSAEAVVDEFLAAMDAGKSFIIAGARNRLMVLAAHFIPRQILKRLAMKKYSD